MLRPEKRLAALPLVPALQPKKPPEEARSEP